MKMSRRFVGLALLVASVLAAARTSDGATAPAPALQLVGDAVTGKQTFTEYCSVCHGVGAKGFIGPKIGGINWTTAGLHEIVRGGVGGYGSMPAFNADAVSDQRIADIAAYLAGPTPPPVPQPSGTPAPAAIIAAPPPAGASASPASAAPATPGADAAHGRAVYTANCAACHGASGQGGFGPNLHGEKSRKNTAAAIAWIKNPQPPMPKLYPSVLTAKDVDDVAAYVESL